MEKEWLRVWQEMDFEDVSKHLIIVGDLMGNCGNCPAMGIDYKTAKECPQCKAKFKYITNSDIGKDAPTSRLRQFQQNRPDLIFVDAGDYKTLKGRKEVKKIF